MKYRNAIKSDHSGPVAQILIASGHTACEVEEIWLEMCNQIKVGNREIEQKFLGMIMGFKSIMEEMNHGV